MVEETSTPTAVAREGTNTNITQDEAVDASVFLARKTMIRLLKLSRKLPGEGVWKSLTAFPNVMT